MIGDEIGAELPDASHRAPPERDLIAATDWTTAERAPWASHHAIPIVAAVACGAAATAGAAALVLNPVDLGRLPLLAMVAAAMGATTVHARAIAGSWDRQAIILAVAAVIGAAVLALLPEYLYGYEINGIIHRSLFTAIILLAVGLPAFSLSLYYALGATPSAWDTSRYPLIVFPIGLALLAYGTLIVRLIVEGGPDLSWDLVVTAYDERLEGTAFVTQAGVRNHLLGSLLLVLMTSIIALPLGVAAGVCMSEYRGFASDLIRFSTLLLRAISVFILGATAFTLVDYADQYPTGNLISDLLRGYYFDADGFQHPGHGSFLTAALVLSLLVIPVIARSTEEGLRSVPRDIREGSIALGATEGHGFLRILMPWALPNIVTGLLLGCAEAAGSVAVLLFIAGSGEFGVGPLREVTSLGYLVFYSDRGPKTFLDVMGQYQFSAALLLLMITFALSLAALYLKHRFARRYRGGISFQ